jgi:uncharacterized protein
MTVTILLWVLAILLIAAGLAGLVLPALPGPPLLYAGLFIAASAEDFAYVGAGTLVALGVMAALAWLADFVAGAFGARRYGSTQRAVVGAALGALVGIAFGLAGFLLGPFIGAVLGELTSRRGLAAAGRAGWGATVGIVLGTAVKLALGCAMLGWFLIARFF